METLDNSSNDWIVLVNNSETINNLFFAAFENSGISLWVCT